MKDDLLDCISCVHDRRLDRPYFRIFSAKSLFALPHSLSLSIVILVSAGYASPCCWLDPPYDHSPLFCIVIFTTSGRYISSAGADDPS